MVFDQSERVQGSIYIIKQHKVVKYKELILQGFWTPMPDCPHTNTQKSIV